MLDLKNRKSPSSVEKERLLKESLEPVRINTINELQQILGKILAKHKEDALDLCTEVNWNSDGKKVKTMVSGISKGVSIYQMLLDGMKLVDKRIKAMQLVQKHINEAKKKDESIVVGFDLLDIDNIKFNVDALIIKELGGTRHGLRIRWNLSDGIYEFDPFTTKLYRVENEHAKSS